MGKIIPVIMAGGSGRRLWPLSQENNPKQFLKLINDFSLFQQTIFRNYKYGDIVVTINKSHQELALKQIKETGINVDLIVEQAAKNTAPSSIIAALNYAIKGDEIFIFLPADHYINNQINYDKVLTEALLYIQDYDLVTIGSKITSANINYGYIKTKVQIADNVYIVDKFKEKPDIQLATEYYSQGNYLWNCGIFIINASFLLKVVQKSYPTLYSYIYDSFLGSSKKSNVLEIPDYPYSAIIPISLDHAIIEHIKHMVVIKEDFGWQDLGSFEALQELEKKQAISADIIDKLYFDNMYRISDSAVAMDQNKERFTDLNIIDDTAIKPSSNTFNQLHFNTSRAWGHYNIIDYGNGYKIKKIMITPGEKISLQYHHHRAEHWVIVEGTAEVNINHEIKIAQVYDSFYIPSNVTHQITNIGNSALCFIEIQTGSYLGEDDIVRLRN